MTGSNRGTDLPEFINDLDGGVFAEKIAIALSRVAAGVVDHNKAGDVTLKFKIDRIGNSYRVGIKHTIDYEVPEANGSYRQKNTTESVMHVNKGGRITVWPEDQHQLLTKTGEPNPQDQE